MATTSSSFLKEASERAGRPCSAQETSMVPTSVASCSSRAQRPSTAHTKGRWSMLPTAAGGSIIFRTRRSWGASSTCSLPAGSTSGRSWASTRMATASANQSARGRSPSHRRDDPCHRPTTSSRVRWACNGNGTTTRGTTTGASPSGKAGSRCMRFLPTACVHAITCSHRR